MKKGQQLSRQTAFCIAVALLTAAAFLIFARENRKSITERNLEYIQDSTIQIAGHIDDVFSEGYECIGILSTFLGRSLEKPEVDVDLLREIVADSVFDFIEYVDKDGNDHNVTGGISDARDREYYIEGMKGNTGMEVIFNSRATHETLLMFYAPVVYEEETVGVLVGVYQAVGRISQLLSAAYFGEEAELYLCMPGGRVVASDQPLDTEEVLNITDLAGEDAGLSKDMLNTMKNGENLTFSTKDGAAGCMTKLEKNGWFLIQIFPQAANDALVKEANAIGMKLELFLLIVFGIVIVILMDFYKRERRNIQEIAEERGKYKNAVLADAIIVFEANLTQNVIKEGAWKGTDGKAVSTEEVLGISLPCSYDTYIDLWVSRYVNDDSREMFIENTGRDYLKKAFEEGKSEITFDYYARTLDGKEISARRSIYLVRDGKTGDLIAYSNVKDITEQKSRERKMHQYEQMLATTASGMYKGVRQIDLSDFTTTYLSFENDHVVTQDKGNWNTWFDEQEAYVYPEDVKKLRETLSAKNLLRLPVGDSIRCDFRSRGKNENGINRVYSVNAIKIVRDGKEYVNLVTMDNTATVENEMKQKALIEDALRRAENASRAKTTFLSNMSHDIRTPMNAIIGFTTLAITHIDNKKQVEDYLGKIASSGSHLLSLINDVLDMSRIESGRLRLDEAECSLPDVMHELRDILIPDMKSRKLEFYIDTVDLMDEQVICDRLRLNQILLNLLGNAMKFTEPGGSISVRIIEKAGKRKDTALYEFRVKDTGIGMSEDFQRHIFEPFERERNSTISGIQGTGLGMAITKNIVEMMGGTISVKSEKNVGTEFVVQIPMKIAVLEKKDIVIRELEGIHALVVDDDFNTCDSVSAMLIQIGMRADWTMHGREAVMRTSQAVQRNDPYGVYIIDWLMPDMNGVEIARQIRKEVGDECPIIILTAYDWNDIEDEAREAGVTAFMSKPLFLSGLRRCLLNIIHPQEETKPDDMIRESISGRRILLAEDNDLNREIARELLGEAGLVIEEAQDGRAAVDRLLEKGAGYYDLVLMDIQMPIMDGYEAAKQIRSLEDRRLADIPIIAMTANAFEEDKKKAIEAGMNAHIAKPIDVEKLLDTLEQVMQSG